MKKIAVIIKMVSPMLANSIRPEDGENATDKFDRDASGRIQLRRVQLYSMLNATSEFSPLTFNIDGIKYDTVIECDAPTEIYYRAYSQGGNGKRRMHESVPAGARVTLRMEIPDTVDADLVQELFETAGRRIGLSPYGFRFGFGRFKVDHIDEPAQQSADDDKRSEIFIPGEK